ncbi:MAG: hypothetical protein B6244_12060 [Candidatus Cloacimonetes bacterium 4572_55]|nr:MAG: hypothetical protein B6244_12060 [Candidatus Cloacimonetes bacterium 4572_55]
MEHPLSLDKIKAGEWATIKKVNAKGRFKKRLIEMGFVENTKIYVQKSAPLNDPVEYVIKGYHVSLRRSEAAQVAVSQGGS